MTPSEFKEIREHAELTQTQLADMLGKKRDSVVKYEAGRAIPVLVERFMNELKIKN